MKIAVVTVNYFNPEETVACIKSFDKLKKIGLTLSFFVVDNGGSAESNQNLSRKLPQARIIKSINNLGFAGGSNLGIKLALKEKADYVLLINPDTIIETKDFFTQMLSVKADLVAPLIRYRENNLNIYDSGGKIDRLFGRNTHLTAHTKKIGSGKPDYFSGACILISSSVLRKIGLLNEGYFLYYEDADFCLRALKAGFSLSLCREAIIYHHLSTTTSKIGKKKISIIAASHLRFCRTHLPFLSSPFYLLFNLYLRFKTLLP